MAVPIIPNIVEWTIVPQKGTTTFYDDMNAWLAQTNTVVNSWNTTLNSTNAVYQDIYLIYNQIQNADPTSGYSQAYTNRSQIAGYSEYKAVGAETSILTADNTNLQLYKNDVLLVLTTDYTLNVDGVTVDLVAPLILDDLMQWYDLNKLKNSFYEKSEVYNKAETNNLLDDKLDNNLNSLSGIGALANQDLLLIGNSGASFVSEKMTWLIFKDSISTFTDTLYSRSTAIFGIGQSTQNVLGSRTSGVTYTNSTGKPISVQVEVGATSASAFAYSIVVNGITLRDTFTLPNNSTYGSSASFTVGNNETYVVTAVTACTIDKWTEFR